MADNLEKLKRDHKYLYTIYSQVQRELSTNGTVNCLQSSVEEYNENKADMEKTVKK